MQKMISYVKILLTSLATIFIYLVGGIDEAIKSLFLLMLMDYCTGVFAAIHTKTLSSQIGFEGIFKKVVYIFLIGIGAIVDRLTTNDGTLRNMIIYFFISNDGISILENCAKMGITFPKKIKEILLQVKGDNKIMEETKEIITEPVVETIEEPVIEVVENTITDEKEIEATQVIGVVNNESDIV